MGVVDVEVWGDMCRGDTAMVDIDTLMGCGGCTCDHPYTSG